MAFQGVKIVTTMLNNLDKPSIITGDVFEKWTNNVNNHYLFLTTLYQTLYTYLMYVIINFHMVFLNKHQHKVKDHEE